MHPKLQAARTRLLVARPYFHAAALTLRPVEQPGLGTLATDRHWRLYYDPAAVERWSVEELEAVLCHELWHLLRRHAERAQPDAPRWNIAADLEINPDLTDEGFTLPAGTLQPQQFHLPGELLAEEYYARLPAAPDPDPAGAGEAAPDCGSAAHGQPRPYERPPDDPAAPGLGAAEAELVRRQVATAAQQHRRERGELPDHLARWAEATLRSRTDWRRLLQAHVRHGLAYQRGRVDYTYARVSRRQLPKVVLPGLQQPLPRVAVVVDTSGSMGARDLAHALAEVTALLRQLGEVTVLSCDAAVHGVARVRQQRQLALAGGGGTDLRVGLAAALALRPAPSVLVAITDGYTPWPAVAPPVPLVVCRTDPAGTAPAYARVVDLED